MSSQTPNLPVSVEPTLEIARLLGGGEPAQQLIGLQSLFGALNGRTVGVLVFADSRPGHEPLVIPFGDPGPLALLRRLLLQAVDFLVESELKIAARPQGEPHAQ